MKKILWLLLILNGLAGAAWLAGFSLPSKPTAQQAAPTQDAKRLQLLSELPRLPPRTGELGITADAPLGAADDGEASPASGEPRLSSPPVVDPAGSAEPASAPAEPANGSERPPVVAVVPETPASASGASPAAQPPAATAITEPSSVPDGGPLCYRTGFLSGDKHEAAGASLRKAGVSDLKLSQRGRARPRYWVYWSGSLGEVGAVEQALKSAAMRDWYRFRGSEGGAGISLGVFGQRSTAQKHQRNLAAKGIQAQIGERYAPQAQLRWTFTVDAAAADTLKASMQRQGVSLEICP